MKIIAENRGWVIEIEASIRTKIQNTAEEKIKADEDLENALFDMLRTKNFSVSNIKMEK